MELSILFAESRQAITSAWAKELLGMPQVQAGIIKGDELQALVTDSLDGLGRSIKSPSRGDSILSDFSGLVRLMDSNLAGLVEALWLCRKAVMPLIQEVGANKRDKLVSQLDCCLCNITVQMSGAITDHLHQHIDQARERTAIIIDIVRTVSSTLDLGEVLTQAGNAISTAAGANHCFFYLVDMENEGDLWSFVPATTPLPKEMVIASTRMGKIPRDHLSPSDAAWQVIKEKQPVSIYDAQTVDYREFPGKIRLCREYKPWLPGSSRRSRN